METRLLIDVIKCAKLGDDQSKMNLIERFNPTLRKYAHRLTYDDYEDAYADLTYEFLVLLEAFPVDNHFVNDGAVVNYIRKAMKRSFFYICKKKMRYNEVPHEASEIAEYMDAVTEDYPSVLLDTLRELLTNTEFKVIYQMFGRIFSEGDRAYPRSFTVQYNAWSLAKLHVTKPNIKCFLYSRPGFVEK